MEFEKNAPVSDEQRHLAEAKRITLQPAHTNVAPEDISDSEIARRHINGQPIGNVSNDIEQNASTLQQADDTTESNTPSVRKQSVAIILIPFGVAILVIGASLYIILR